MKISILQDSLIVLNENLTYYFFLDSDEFLHYNIYTNNNILVLNKELALSILEFSVTTDTEGNIHLICISSKGELLYYINKNDKWAYKTILKLDIKSNKYKYLFLHIYDAYTHILYTKTNILTQGLSSIEHIYWDREKIQKIVVGNYIHGRYTSPFQISLDKMNNFHIVYKVYHENNHQLYYSRFNISTKVWTVSELITNLQEDHSHPYILIDKEENLHLLWSTIEENNFILKYKKKNINHIKSKWSKAQSLSSKNTNNISPILIQESDTLKIYSKQNNQIIEIISEDFGDSWTNLTNESSYIVKEAKIIQYCANFKKENKYLAKHVYGNVKDTIEIIGVRLFNNKEKSKPSQTQASLDEYKNSTYEIKENYNNTVDPSGLDNAVNGLDNITSNFDNTSSKFEKSNSIIKELLYDYNILEKQLLKIEKDSLKLTESIDNHNNYLNLLNENIIDHKNQMLIFQEKFNNISSNNSFLKSFLNFFK